MRPQIRTAARVAARRANSSQATSNPQIKQAVETVKRVAGPVGDRVGSLFGSYRGPITYNFNVFTSLLRQIYQAERLAPPTQLSTWASAYAQIWSRATSASWWRQAFSSGEWAKVAIAGVEAYGLYKIGEILGRRNLIGYKIKEHQ